MDLLQLLPWLVFTGFLKISLGYVINDSSGGALYPYPRVYLNGGTSVDRKSAFIGGSVLGARQKGTTWIQGVERKVREGFISEALCVELVQHFYMDAVGG